MIFRVRFQGMHHLKMACHLLSSDDLKRQKQTWVCRNLFIYFNLDFGSQMCWNDLTISKSSPVIIFRIRQRASVQVMPMKPLLLQRHPLQLRGLSVHGLQLMRGRHLRDRTLQLSWISDSCEKHKWKKLNPLKEMAVVKSGVYKPNSGWRSISWSWGRSTSKGFGIGPPGKGNRAKRGPVAIGSTRGWGLEPKRRWDNKYV